MQKRTDRASGGVSGDKAWPRKGNERGSLGAERLRQGGETGTGKSMTKPIDPFSLNGKPIAKGPEKRPETAEEILRRLREKAGRASAPGSAGPAGRDLPRAAAAGQARAHGRAPAEGEAGEPAGMEPALQTHAASTNGTGEAAAVSASDVDSLLMEGPSGASSRSHLPVLAAVFLVSAIAGGTLAGMIFSSRLAPGTGTVADGTPVSQSAAETTKAAASTPSARPNETVVVPNPAPVRAAGSGTGTPARLTEKPVKVAKVAPSPTARGNGLNGLAAKGSDRGSGQRIVKDEARILPAGSGGTPAVKKGASVAAVTATPVIGKPVAEAADPAPALPAVKALPAASGKSKADGVAIASAGAAATAGSEEPAAGRDELRALTDNVVAALAGLTQAGDAVTEQQTGNVREALSALVERALAEGRNEDDVARLLEQALNDSGEAAVPAALRDASGKVDLRLLLASIIPMEAAHRASGAEQDYVNQLVAEGERTVVLEDGGKPAAKGRFYFRNGKRYTRIRPGDTLSRIAFEAYGDVLAYPVILRANAGRISIRRLKPGMEIEVPLRKDAGLRGDGPVKLTPKARTAGRKAARATTRKAAARRTARKATKARAQPRKAAEAAAQPAAETPQAPRKFINFRSRFTGGPDAAESR